MASFLLLVVLLLVLAALAWARWRPRPVPSHQEPTCWRVVLPRDASFPPARASAWFAALSALLVGGSDRLTIDLIGQERELHLLVTAPRLWEAALRGQLAAWFPHARLELHPQAAPIERIEGAFAQEKPAIFSLRPIFEAQADPLLGVLGVLLEADAPAGISLTLGPPPPDWKVWAAEAAVALARGDNPPPRGWRFELLRLVRLFRPAEARGAPAAALRAKAEGPVFSVQLTAWASGDPGLASARCGRLTAALADGYRDPDGNALKPNAESSRARQVRSIVAPTLVLAAAELGALIHLPDQHPLVPGEITRRIAPANTAIQTAATEVTCLGEALHSERPVPFGLTLPARRQHLYVVGKTGTGKSTLLATILRQDLEAGRGVALIDPHGDLAERALALIPPERTDEVLYFNPADRDFPVAFNPLASTRPEERPLVASGVVSAFKKLYGESWGPRLEYILRNALLALLETPAPSLLLLPRLLTDKPFRQSVTARLHDPILLSFFREEYEQYDPRWRLEAISPILNKVGQFLSSPVVRHVVGQSASGFSLRELMDRGGVFVANLASGKIGEDNASLLGNLLVSGFQLAAMSRAEQPEANRQDFHLAVDEFQHFATDAFGTILSEARKYRLALTLSHQYLDQLPPGVSDAVFGNVGSLCVFRVGAADTTRLAKELAPTFDGQDLVHLPDHYFCARIAREGEVVPAFSARTVSLVNEPVVVTPLIDTSRQRWARPRAAVELEIADLWEGRIAPDAGPGAAALGGPLPTAIPAGPNQVRTQIL